MTAFFYLGIPPSCETPFLLILPMSIVTPISDRPMMADRETIDLDTIENAPSPRLTSFVVADIPMTLASSFGATRRFLELAEFSVVFGAAIATKVVYIDWFLGSNAGWAPYLIVALLLGCILHITGKQMGLNNVEKLTGPDLDLGKTLGGLAISFLIVLGVLYTIKQSEAVSRGWILSWLGLSAILIVGLRAVAVNYVMRAVSIGRLARRVAVVGTREFAMSLSERLAGTVTTEGNIDLYDVQAEAPDDRFVRSLIDLQRGMQNNSYDWVIVAMPMASADTFKEVVRLLGGYTTELMISTDAADQPVPTTGVRQLGGVRADVVHALPGSEISWLMKRAMDLILTAIAALLLLPLFAIVAVLIKLDSRGPILFCQRRIGQNNVPFTIFKFRTMTVLEDGAVVVQATRGDRRVTRIGRYLRGTSVDELPQLFNVLLGNMSLVGPRPHAVAHDNEFDQQFDLFSRRRRVKPGITGWAQVKGFRGETKSRLDVMRRMECDLYYINNWSIWLDIEIMARTVFVFAKGAY